MKKILGLLSLIAFFTTLILPIELVCAEDKPAFNISTGNITIFKDGDIVKVTYGGGTTVDINPDEEITIIGTTKDYRVVVNGVTAKIKVKGVNIESRADSPFAIINGGNVTLKLAEKNILTSTHVLSPGLKVENGNTLTIVDSEEGGTNTITANGGAHGASIGGGYNGVCGTITINGGTVTANTANTSYYGAGIGGGDNGAGGTITINGGTITANGGYIYGAGIGGGGYNGAGGTITINGGTVTANGSYSGVGIGGGDNGTDGIITINSEAIVKATSGSKNAIAGTCGGTAKLLMVNFERGKGNGINTTIYGDGIEISYAPNIEYKSLAVTVPSTGIYQLKTENKLQRHGDDNLNIDFVIGEDVLNTFTSVIDVVTCTVGFFRNDGSPLTRVDGVIQGKTITLPEVPTKEGYIFRGWYTDNKTFINEFTNTTKVTKDIVLYAKWIDKAVEDVDNMITSLPAVGDLKLTDKEAVAVAREAYDALTSDQKLLVTKLNDLELAETKISELQAAADKVLSDKAAAEDVDNMITSLPAVGDLKLTDKEAVAVAREAYDVLTSDQKLLVTKLNDLEAAESKISELQAEFDLIEETKTYTITFNSNAGSLVATITAAKNGTITLPIPTKKGYTFGGWYKESGLINKFTNATPVTENINLYAKWIQDVYYYYYTVTFNSNGGSAINTMTVRENGTVNLLKAPIKEGYIFDGWYTDNGTFAKEFTKLSRVTRNITLYAKWIDKAVEDVDNMIIALPAVEKLKLTDGPVVLAARTAYTALTVEQQALVTKLNDLESIETKLAELQASFKVWDGQTVATDVPANKEWRIKFNKNVDLATAKENIYIIDNETKQLFSTEVFSSEDGKVIILKLEKDKLFTSGKTYTLYINSDVKNIEHSGTLKTGIKMEFTIK